MNDAFSELIRLAGTKRMVGIGALTMVVAATEGLGFLLLVPLLEGMDSGDGAPSQVSRAFAQLGLSSDIELLLCLFVALVTGRVVADHLRAMQSLEVSISIVDGLRARAFSALVEADWRRLTRMHQGENRALLITTIESAAVAADVFFSMMKTVLSLGAVAVAALLISPLAALAAVAAGVVVLALYGGLRRRAQELGEALIGRHRTMHARLEENLDALRLIKSFGNEQRAREEVASGFSGMREVQRRYLRDTGRARVVLQAGAALVLAAMVFAALRWGETDPATLLPLVALFGRGVPQLGALQESWQRWAHTSPSLVAARRLIAEAESAAEPPVEAIPEAPRLMCELRVDHVSLHHRTDQPALDDVTLAIDARTTVALVGESGAGKSTLADLLGGLLAPDQGTSSVDGQMLDPPHRRAWRRRVAYVQQEPVLFAGTIRENLAWALADAPVERLEEVLRMASAEFVFALPDGIDHLLGERGRQLSGGERQRIVLARALLRDPDLLILDEATSALDPASDEAVARAVARLKGSCTILIVGHRGALTAIAERRVVLARGKVIADETLD